MRINRFFQETLGAQPKNPHWSWGAIDPDANRVFLRVWEDQIDNNGKRVRVLIGSVRVRLQRFFDRLRMTTKTAATLI